MAEARVTKAGVYVEVEGASVGVTKAGVYVEISKREVNVTLVGLYLEIDIPCPERPVYPSEGYTTIGYGGTDITQYCTQADLEALVNEVDATNLASTGPETAPGGTTWLVNIAGKLTRESDDILGRDAVTTPDTLRSLTVTVGAGSRCGTTYGWVGAEGVGAFVSDYKIGPNDPLKETTMWTAKLGVSGGPARSGGRTVAQ
jgi:hypothetical protein